MAGWKSTTRSVFNGWQRARDHGGCTLPDVWLFYCAQGTKTSHTYACGCHVFFLANSIYGRNEKGRNLYMYSSYGWHHQQRLQQHRYSYKFLLQDLPIFFLQHKIYQVWHPRTILQKDKYARLIYTLETITTILVHRPARPVPLVQPVRPWLWGGKDGILTYRDAALWSIDSSILNLCTCITVNSQTTMLAAFADICRQRSKNYWRCYERASW